MTEITDGIYYDFVWNNKDPFDFIKAIKENKDFHTICIVGPEEHQPTEYYTNKYEFDFFITYCKHHNKKVKIILGENSICESPGITLPWHTYVLNMTIKHHVMKNTLPKVAKNRILKPFVSMNGRAHPHRLLFLDHMEKYSLIDKGFVSFHNFENVTYNDRYEFRWWKPKRLSFDRAWWNPPDGYKDFLIPPEQFKLSLWSIVCESNTKINFITEKTWIPIFHRRPFLVFSGVNFHKNLKEKYGIELFEEYVDYSFDNVEDDETRCDMFMQQVEKICKIDLYEQQKILAPKIEHNFTRILDMIQDPDLVDNEIRFYIEKTNSQLCRYNKMLNIGRSEEFINFLIQNRLDKYLK